MVSLARRGGYPKYNLRVRVDLVNIDNILELLFQLPTLSHIVEDKHINSKSSLLWNKRFDFIQVPFIQNVAEIACKKTAYLITCINTPHTVNKVFSKANYNKNQP